VTSVERTTFNDSSACVDVKLTVPVTETVSPRFAERVEALSVKVEVAALKYACDVPAEVTPNPNAATKASATRLNDIDLLVICFLSIVVLETFSNTAGEENFAL
jgi:hypothetical protein